jgi:predicted RNA-binding protein Jag
MDLHERVREFTKETVAAMGLPLDVDGRRRRRQHSRGVVGRRAASASVERAEALDALQQIVNTAFRAS